MVLSAVAEIERVAKPQAVVRLRLDCHLPTPTEPIQLDNERIRRAFQKLPVELIDERHYENKTDTLWGTRTK